MTTDLSNAVLSGAAFCVMQNAGRFAVCDEDQLDFLQRQSTNDLRKLESQPYVLTVLTSSVARIVDVLAVYKKGDCLDVITLPDRGMATIGFLKSKIFFSDKVKIVDVSENTAQIRLIGEITDEIIQWLILKSTTRVYQFAFFSERVIVFDKDYLEEISALIEAAGGMRVDKSDYDALRIEHGIPGYEGELTDQHTPLEVGLRDLISETKGCYTGQEIIARQINYDKVTKQLFGIRLSGEVAIGDVVEANGKRAGEVTSAANAGENGWIALAILRTASASAGDEVSVAGATGTLVEIPFRGE